MNNPIPPSPKGFTLLELLLASFMTFFVVSAAGYAIVVMTRENLATEVSSDLRFNLNRAADFISAEVQQAKEIRVNAAIPSPLPSNCGALTSGVDQAVIGLVVDTPASPNATAPTIIYYTKTPPGSPWTGPSSIYRCGPPLDSDGNFATPSPTPHPSPTSQILVDSIATTGFSTACSSGTLYPTSPAAGFTICGPASSTPPIKLVDLRLTARTNALANRGMTTTGGQGRFDDNATYSVTTKVFARSGSP